MKGFTLLSIGPDGSTEVRGMYGSKSAASRQLNRNLRDAARHPHRDVWHNGCAYPACEVGYRIEAAKGEK